MRVMVQIRETDIDTLERCCAAMAYGDLNAEDPANLSDTNFTRLFRLAQLTVEYLLHIQDRLVWEIGLLRVCFFMLSLHPHDVSASSIIGCNT
jgi:hypothetical protein